MPEYTFENVLSPTDFEKLSRDLAQSQFKVYFETFKPGKDGGIDLRHSTADGVNWILQAKHWVRSGFSKLQRELKNEREKVRKLNPERYLLFTSVPLSPANKTRIVEILAHPSVSTEYVYGQDDINNLLGEHKDVEKRHFKLWFSSVPVFEKILNRKSHHLTEDMLSRIQSDSRLYVQNGSFQKALDILEQEHVCIIAGPPGIGKTMLAEALMIYHAQGEFVPVSITQDIKEAYNFSRESVQYLFHYDDFLGKASRELRFGKNEEKRLIEFIQAIRRGKHSRLVLTTREYILNQTKTDFEEFRDWNENASKLVLGLDAYTRRMKAEIFANHIYFSDISQEHKDALIASESLVTIVDHKNYTPRIIRYATDSGHILELTPEKYTESFLRSLDNPRLIWEQAFERGIGPACQDLIYCHFALMDKVLMEDIRTSFNAFHKLRCERLGIPRRDNDFNESLREADGTFIQTLEIQNIDAEPDYLVQFENGSIKDYIASRLLDHSEVLSTLVESAHVLQVIESLWGFRSEGGTFLYRSSLLENRDVLLTSLKRFHQSMLASRSGSKDAPLWSAYLSKRTLEDLALLVSSILSVTDDQDYLDLLEACLEEVVSRISLDIAPVRKCLALAKQVSRLKCSVKNSETLLLSIVDYMDRDYELWSDFELATDFIEAFPEVSEKFKIETAAHFEKRIAEPDAFDGLYSPNAMRAAIEHMSGIALVLGVNVDTQVQELEEMAETEEDLISSDPDWRESILGRKDEDADITDEEIASLVRRGHSDGCDGEKE